MLTTKWRREARTKQEEGGMFAAAGQRVAEKSYGLREEGGVEGSLAPWYARLAGFPCNACKL